MYVSMLTILWKSQTGSNKSQRYFLLKFYASVSLFPPPFHFASFFLPASLPPPFPLPATPAPAPSFLPASLSPPFLPLLPSSLLFPPVLLLYIPMYAHMFRPWRPT